MPLIALLTLLGCSLFGHTRPTPVSLEPAAFQDAAPVSVASVDMDASQSHLEVVGAYPIGRFVERDLDNLRLSLQRSLVPLSGGPDGDDGLDVHVYVRSYHVSASNNAGGALATVAWCAVDVGGRLVHREQLYAYDSVVLVKTMGALKNTVQAAAVRRIAEAGAHLAAGGDPADLPLPENTSFDYDEAVRTLPSSLQSRYVGVIGGYVYAGSSGVGAADYGNAATDDFDWDAYLSSR